MAKDISQSTAKHGMNKSDHIDFIKSHEYTHAKNSNLQDLQDGGMMLQSEASNLLTVDFGEYKVIGAKNIYGINKTIYFLHEEEEEKSRIVLVSNKEIDEDKYDQIIDCPGCQSKNIMTDPLENLTQTPDREAEIVIDDECNGCLKFSLEHPIKHIVVKEEAVGVMVYFTDYNNEQRVINLDRKEWYTDNTKSICGEEEGDPEDKCLDCRKLRLHPQYSPIIAEAKTLQGSGNLKRGTYQTFLAYVNEEGLEMSEYQAITLPVAVFDQQNRTLTQKELIEDKTDTAIKIGIDHIDSQMKHYKMVVAKRNDEGWKFYVEGIFSTDNREVILTTEDNKNLIDKEMLFLTIPKINKAEIITESNRMLIQGNVETEADWNLQPVVNFIGSFSNWVTVEATEKFYEDGVNSANKKSNLRDEVAAKSIRFLTDTGYITPLYPIISRPPNIEETRLKDEDSIEYKSVQQGNTTCDLGGREYVWQYENTAENLGWAEGYEETGEEVSRKLEYYCQVNGLGIDEGAVRIILENYENRNFLGLKSFINTNRDYILSYEGDDTGLLQIKDMLDPTEPYEDCLPSTTEMLEGCNQDPEQLQLVMDDTEIASVVEEKAKFIETPFSLEYEESSPPRYSNLYFVDTQGEEVQDEVLRYTILHAATPWGSFYRKSMRKHWELPIREIYTNNFSCKNSDTLPYYESFVRGEDQSYLMNYNVETGAEDEPITALGTAKAKIGNDQVVFTDYKATKRGDTVEINLRDNVHTVSISYSGGSLGEKDLKTTNSNQNTAKYRLSEYEVYTTLEELGGAGKVTVLNVNEAEGKISGTFSYKAVRYKRDIQGNIELDTDGEAIIEEIEVEGGEFSNIFYEEKEEGEESDDIYTAGKNFLLDQSRSYGNISTTPGYKNYRLKLTYRKMIPYKPYGDVRFYKEFHDKALWFKVDIPEDEDVIIEMTKTSEKTCEMRNKNFDFVGAVSLNMFRVSFWETCYSDKPFFTTIVNEKTESDGVTPIVSDLNPENPRNEGLMKRLVTSARRKQHLLEEGMSQTEVEIYDYTKDPITGENILEGRKFFYITVEAPIFSTLAGGGKESKYMLAPSCQSFSMITRAIEYGIVDVSYGGIELKKTQSYLTNCKVNMPDASDCNPRNYEYGEFSYVESRKTYPDNQELYNSTGLSISPTDLKTPGDREKFEGYYTNGIDEEGNYVMDEEANFSCKNIRHFKYPDNEYAPFLHTNSLPEFSDASIYPLAFTINENTISDFLDIAVKNGLITEEQRDSIVGYEIYTGSREGNKSIQAKGMLFDSYEYEVREKTIQFSNFPYNDLGSNDLFLDKDGNAIPHPEQGKSNSRYMFMSPDIYNKGGLWATEMSVDSFQYGSSNTTFPEIKGHPKWVILGKKAYSTANFLAWTETVVDITLMLLEGIEAYRIAVGTSSAFNAPGIILHVAATALTLTQNLFVKRGSYKLQWMQTIRDMGTPYNFAHRASGVGKYNYIGVNQGRIKNEAGETFNLDNKLRGLTSRDMLGEGLNTITDSLGRIHYVNNIDREKSLYITLGGDEDTGETYSLKHPNEYANYDNSKERYGRSSRFSLGEVDTQGGPDVETIRNIASPYATLKNYMPEQYGEIGSVKWLPTSYYGDLKNRKTQPKIYTGDSYISRFSEIRKMPMYLVDAMDQASLTTFEYKKNSNIGERTKFYVDYETGGEERTQSLVMPEIRSDYQLDCESGEEGFYLKPPSKFYMQYYGIVDYMVESDINANYRYAKEGIENSFYPQEPDHVRLTEQVVRPIRTPNTMIYDKTFSGNPIRTAIKILLNDYERKTEELKAKGRGLMIQSEPDNDEFSKTDPWTIYRPLNMYKAPTSAGELVSLDGVESNQIVARFERGFSIINAVDTIQRITTKDSILGKGGIFATRPMEFHHTDGGYAGTQNHNFIRTEFGHIWADAEAGQVFLATIGGNGMPQLQEITSRYGDEDTKMAMWFKNHLPFKVKKTGLDVDIDNSYNGIGLAMVYDSRNKRVLITKKDYIIKDKTLVYHEKKFRLTEGTEVNNLINEGQEGGWEYRGIEDNQLKFTKEGKEKYNDLPEVEITEEKFKDVSWTISFYFQYGRWGSFYDYIPNYYIPQKNYFQSGINTEESNSLWSHHLTRRSFQVYYGEAYKWEVEVPFETKGANRYLEDVEYRLDAIRYQDNFDYYQNEEISFDEAVIYNNTASSGKLQMVNRETIAQQREFPQRVDTITQKILQTNKEGVWAFNYFYNRVKDLKNRMPLWRYDENQIDKEVNRQAVSMYGKRQLDRLRGQNFLINLKSGDTQHQKAVKIVKTNENLYK